MRPRSVHGARRLISAGLLVPAILFFHPAAGSTEARTDQPSVQRSASTDTAKPPSRASATRSAHSAVPCVHVVRLGESLTRIASRYHVARQAIASANRLGSVKAVKAGDRLAIPANTSAASAN